MTFKDQLRWCRVWGFRLVLTGLAALAILVLVTANSAHRAVSVLAALCNLTAFAGVILLVVGGLFRPWQKRLYHWMIEPNHQLRGWAVSTPGLGWFLWITPEGQDRDG